MMVKRDDRYFKKVLYILIFIVALNSTPAHGFFNSDCKNLAKRTASNQAKYEKAWNLYQTSLANWLNAGGKSNSFNPVLSRLRQVGNLQVTILEDFGKYPKCMKVTNLSHYSSMKIEIQNAIRNANWIDIRFSPLFSDIVDWRKELK